MPLVTDDEVERQVLLDQVELAGEHLVAEDQDGGSRGVLDVLPQLGTVVHGERRDPLLAQPLAELGLPVLHQRTGGQHLT